MAELNAPIDAAPRPSTAARIGWTILILATLYVCYFSHLSALGFVGPDEPRYAWIARDMAESGDWVTPRLYGKPWFEKPVLYYWGAAAFFKLSGVQGTPSPSGGPLTPNPSPRFSAETAARLPSAIAALLATLALAWLALRLYGPETARWLLLLLPTTVGMIGFSHAAATDMPFSSMLTIAMVFAAVLLRLVSNSNPSASNLPATVIANGVQESFARTQGEVALSSPEPRQQSPSALYLILFGFFLGLAVLAKGPAALILSGGAVFFWALLTKRWRDAFRLLHPIAIASFCLTALPWYILCSRRNPDFLRIFIIEHNFKRYLTPEFQHIQPFWYYLPVLLLAFFPWLAPLLWSLYAGSRHLLKTKSASPATTFLLCWSAFCIFFFSTSHSKLPGYILPAIPAVGLLLAHSIISLAPRHRISFFLTLFAGAFLLFSAAVALPRVKASSITRLGDAVLLISAVLLCASVSNAFLASISFFGRARHIPLVLSILPALFLLFSVEEIRSRRSLPDPSPRYLAQQIIREKQFPLDRLRILKVSRANRFILDFYLRHELLDWDNDPTREAYVLVDGFDWGCPRFAQIMECSDLWIEQERTDAYHILHVLPKEITAQPSP